MNQSETAKSNVNLDFEPFSEPTLFNQMKPYCCPVCGGKGIVPSGFYSFPGNFGGVTSTCAETCRACGGKGYILV